MSAKWPSGARPLTPRRKGQLVEAQTRRRNRLDEQGFKLVQGFVPREKASRFRDLKDVFDVTTMGAVLLRLLDEWDRRDGHQKSTTPTQAE